MSAATVTATIPTPRALQSLTRHEQTPVNRSAVAPAFHAALMLRSVSEEVVWSFVAARDQDVVETCEGVERVRLDERIDDSQALAAAPRIFEEVFPALARFIAAAGDQPVVFVVGHRKIRAAIADLPGLAGVLVFADSPDLSHHLPYRMSHTRALELYWARLDLLPPPVRIPHVEVATDASVGKGRALAGLAWVSADGRHGTDTLPISSPAAAELRAFALAVRAHADIAEHVHILTDCREAMSLAREALEHGRTSVVGGHRQVHAALVALLCVSSNVKVTFEWVKGHNGFALNDAADRLAVLARRHEDAGVGPEQHAATCERVVADLIVDPAAAVTAA